MWGGVSLMTIVVLILVTCCRVKGLHGDFLVATFTSMVSAVYFLQWWQLHGRAGDATTRDTFVLDVELNVIRTAAVALGVLFLWIALRWKCTKKETLVLGVPALKRGVDVLRGVSSVLLFLVSVVVLCSVLAAGFYAWLTTMGGCNYEAKVEVDNSTKLVEWTYECSTYVKVSTMVVQWTAAGAVVWFAVLLQEMARLYGARLAVCQFTDNRGDALRHTLSCIGYCQWVALASLMMTPIRLVYWVIMGPYENVRTFSPFHFCLTIERASALQLALVGCWDPIAPPSFRQMQNNWAHVGKISARASELLLACSVTTALSVGLGVGSVVVRAGHGVSPTDAHGLFTHSGAAVAVVVLVVVGLTLTILNAVQAATDAYGILWAATLSLSNGKVPETVQNGVRTYFGTAPQASSRTTNCLPNTQNESPLQSAAAARKQSPLVPQRPVSQTPTAGDTMTHIPRASRNIYATISPPDSPAAISSDGGDSIQGIEEGSFVLNGRGIAQQSLLSMHSRVNPRNAQGGRARGRSLNLKLRGPTDGIASDRVSTAHHQVVQELNKKVQEAQSKEREMEMKVSEEREKAEELARRALTEASKARIHEEQARQERLKREVLERQHKQEQDRARDFERMAREEKERADRIETQRREAFQSAGGWIEFPNYWSHKIADGTNFKLIRSKYMEDCLRKIMPASILEPNCCRMGRVELVRVQRIENAALWQIYAAQKQVMQQQYNGMQPPVISIHAAHTSCHRNAKLNGGINEVMLFHGTKTQHRDRITKTGLDVNMAGAGLYGQVI